MQRPKWLKMPTIDVLVVISSLTLVAGAVGGFTIGFKTGTVLSPPPVVIELTTSTPVEVRPGAWVSIGDNVDCRATKRDVQCRLTLGMAPIPPPYKPPIKVASSKQESGAAP